MTIKLRPTVLVSALTLAYSSLAMSTTIANPGAFDHAANYNAGGITLSASGTSSDSWTFNIVLDGYDIATENVIEALVSLNLRELDNDDGSRGREYREEREYDEDAMARLSADGQLIDRWEVDTGTTILVIDSLITLSTTGELDMTLTASSGSFIFDAAKLQVHDVTAPAVPIPAAIWLFGSGLLGLVGFARARKKA